MKTIILFIALSVLFVCCSKEKKIERRLHKREGKWNIKSHTYTYYVDEQVDTSVNYSTYNAFIFKKNGTGVIETSEGNEGVVFTWLNTDNMLYTESGGFTTSYVITDESRKEMKLESTNSLNNNSKEVTSLILERD